MSETDRQWGEWHKPTPDEKSRWNQILEVCGGIVDIKECRTSNDGIYQFKVPAGCGIVTENGTNYSHKIIQATFGGILYDVLDKNSISDETER